LAIWSLLTRLNLSLSYDEVNDLDFNWFIL
jgi:hypothetical protein